METKKQNLLNNTDLESLMNIVNLNSNLMEATKSIKSKNNESAIKALKALKDKPGVWPELIIVKIKFVFVHSSLLFICNLIYIGN